MSRTVFLLLTGISGYAGAQYVAFLQNFMILVSIALAKMIGTLAPTILVFAAKGSVLLQCLGVVIFFFDLLYLYLVRKAVKQ